MALTHASQEVIWLRQLLEQVGYAQTKPRRLLGDNQGSIALAKNSSDHPHSKHIQLHYHYICFNLAEETVNLSYIPTDKMAADGMTKSLTCIKYETFLDLIGMKPRPSGSIRISPLE